MEDDIDYGDGTKYVNDESIEMAWAIKAAERANIHMNLLISCDTSSLKLNKHQDLIYQTFRQDFPELDVLKVSETELKQGDIKEKWKAFCEKFKDNVEDYALGTLMRIEANKSYSQNNTIIVPKIQYLAIEITRNLEGLNQQHKEAYTEDHKKNGEE